MSHLATAYPKPFLWRHVPQPEIAFASWLYFLRLVNAIGSDVAVYGTIPVPVCAPVWRGIDTVLYVTEGLGFKVKMLAVSAWTGYKFVIVVTAI